VSHHNLFSQPDLPGASLASQEPPLNGKAVAPPECGLNRSHIFG